MFCFMLPPLYMMEFEMSKHYNLILVGIVFSCLLVLLYIKCNVLFYVAARVYDGI